MENEKMIMAELTDADNTKIYCIDPDALREVNFDGPVSYIKYDTVEEAQAVVAGKKEYDSDSAEMLSRDIGNSDILFQDDLIALQARKDADCIICDDVNGVFLLVEADENLEFETAIYDHDGNNYFIEQIENIEHDVEYEKIEDTTPDPAFYYEEKIKIGEKEIKISRSNTSGDLTPYQTEESEETESY